MTFTKIRNLIIWLSIASSLLAVFKLTGILKISWLSVTTPLWGTASLALILILIILLILGFAELVRLLEKND